MASLLKNEGDYKNRKDLEQAIKCWILSLDSSQFFEPMKAIKDEFRMYAPIHVAYFLSCCQEVEMISSQKGQSQDRYEETKYQEMMHYRLSQIAGLPHPLHLGVSYSYKPTLVIWHEKDQEYVIQVMVATTAKLGFFYEDQLLHVEEKTFSIGTLELGKLLENTILEPVPCPDRSIEIELKRRKRHETITITQKEYQKFYGELYLVLGDAIPLDSVTKKYQQLNTSIQQEFVEPLHSMLLLRGKTVGKVTNHSGIGYLNQKKYTSEDHNFISQQYFMTQEEKEGKLLLDVKNFEKLDIHALETNSDFTVICFPVRRVDLSLDGIHYSFMKEKVIQYRDALLPCIQLAYEIVETTDTTKPCYHLIYEKPVIHVESLVAKGWHIQKIKEDKEDNDCSIYYEIHTPKEEEYELVLEYHMKNIEIDMDQCNIALPAFSAQNIKVRLNRCFLENPCQKDTKDLERYCLISNIKKLLTLVKKHNPDFIISHHIKSGEVRKHIDKNQVETVNGNEKNRIAFMSWDPLLEGMLQEKTLTLTPVRHQCNHELQALPMAQDDSVIGKIKPCKKELDMMLEETVSVPIIIKDMLQQGIGFYEIMNLVLEDIEPVNIYLRA